jgi:hypothetical protein
MTGPRPAGRPWSRAEVVQLRELIATGVKVGLVPRKLKRSLDVVYSRISPFKKNAARPNVRCERPFAPFRAPRICPYKFLEQPPGRHECAGRGVAMTRKRNARTWSMKSDRELIHLAKSRTLQAIADHLQRSPAYVLKRAARLGLSIERNANGK